MLLPRNMWCSLMFWGWLSVPSSYHIIQLSSLYTIIQFRRDVSTSFYLYCKVYSFYWIQIKYFCLLTLMICIPYSQECMEYSSNWILRTIIRFLKIQDPNESTFSWDVNNLLLKMLIKTLWKSGMLLFGEKPIILSTKCLIQNTFNYQHININIHTLKIKVQYQFICISSKKDCDF